MSGIISPCRPLTKTIWSDNASAVEVMGDEKLKMLARKLVEKVRGNLSIDWMHRKSTRSTIRVLVKRILRAHGYPPDMQDSATDLVLAQTEALCRDGMELWGA
ncbi:MAG: type I restriction enzyme endonuclease domain-containing protein [Candidatus Eutrophobiaceae bacterium]